MKLSDKILQEIQQKELLPKPKWHFLFHDIVLWSIFGVSVVIGSLSVAVIIYYLTDMDWDMMGDMGPNFLSHVGFGLPHLWIILMLVFVVVAYVNFHHTKKGYRHGCIKIILLSIVSSLAGGGILQAFNLGEMIDSTAQQHVPFYEQVVPIPARRWVNPANGMLAGSIAEIKGNEWIVVDFGNSEWLVNVERAQKPPMLPIRIGERIRMLGRTLGDNYFQADVIRPWLKRGFMREQPQRPNPFLEKMKEE